MCQHADFNVYPLVHVEAVAMQRGKNLDGRQTANCFRTIRLHHEGSKSVASRLKLQKVSLDHLKVGLYTNKTGLESGSVMFLCNSLPFDATRLDPIRSV